MTLWSKSGRNTLPSTTAERTRKAPIRLMGLPLLAVVCPTAVGSSLSDFAIALDWSVLRGLPRFRALAVVLSAAILRFFVYLLQAELRGIELTSLYTALD